MELPNLSYQIPTMKNGAENFTIFRVSVIQAVGLLLQTKQDIISDVQGDSEENTSMYSANGFDS